MAKTTTNTTISNSKETSITKDKSVEELKSLKNENKDLKNTIETMQAQMNVIMQMIANKTEPTNNKSVTNRRIRFVNLTNGDLVLKGSQFWTIEGKYNDRVFTEKEARLIVSNMGSFMQTGCVWIDNADFVKENDLDLVYATLLSDEDLKELLNHDSSYVIETYKNVNDSQKEIIIDTILEQKFKGRKIDSDILVTLSQLSGKNLLNNEEE